MEEHDPADYSTIDGLLLLAESAEKVSNVRKRPSCEELEVESEQEGRKRMRLTVREAAGDAEQATVENRNGTAEPWSLDMGSRERERISVHENGVSGVSGVSGLIQEEPTEVPVRLPDFETLRVPFDQVPYSNNYGLFFNREVYSFFNEPCEADSHLDPSIVSASGIFTTTKGHRRLKVELDDETELGLEPNTVGGSLWTPEEKEKFFVYLARFSRHRLDEIAECIGTKSLIECEVYHQHLFQAYRQHKDKLPMEEIPFAAEMSDSWVEMENVQARSVSLVEDKDVFDSHDELKMKNSVEHLLSRNKIQQSATLWWDHFRERDGDNEDGDQYLPSGAVWFTDECMEYLDYHIRDIVRRLVVETAVVAVRRNRKRNKLGTRLYARDVELAALNLGLRRSTDSRLKCTIFKLGYDYSNELAEFENDQKARDKQEQHIEELIVKRGNEGEEVEDAQPADSSTLSEQLLDRDIDEYRDTDYDEETELKLWDHETRLIDSIDIAISRAQEKILSCWIQTFNDPLLNSDKVIDWLEKRRMLREKGVRRNLEKSEGGREDEDGGYSDESNNEDNDDGNEHYGEHRNEGDYVQNEDSLDNSMIQRFMTTFSGSGYVASM